MKIEKTGNIYPNIYRFNLGNFEITTLLDGLVQRDGPHPIFGQNKEEKDVHQLCKKNFLPEKKFEHGFTPIIINTGTELILLTQEMASLMRITVNLLILLSFLDIGIRI